MTIIPNQNFGLGDIIFTQSLVNIIADGRPIIWPVFPQFVEGLNRAYPHVKFVDHRTLHINYERKEQYECNVEGIGRCTVLPLRWADAILKVPYTSCMRAKYDLYGLDFEIWRDGAMWVRNMDREMSIRQMMPQRFNVVNNFFGSESKHRLNIHLPNEIPVIEMLTVQGFSLFDWAFLLQEAEQIHVANSSIIYILEMLDDIRAGSIDLYQRAIPGQTFETVDYILKKHKYVFHG